MHVLGLKVLFIFLLFSIHPSYSQSDKTPTDSIVAPLIANNSASHISIIDSILNFSKQYLGRPYRGGGKGPNSFDCSGFTSFVFRNFGIKLGSSSGDQAEQLPAIAINDILPGDLVFFNGHRRGSRIGHVGLVVSKHENGTFDFIHSASSVGISISHSESNYYDRRYVSAGRVFTTDSLLANYKFNKQNTKVEPEISIQSEVYDNEKVIETTVKKSIPAKYHTVKSGETLSSIANKYGLTVAQLKKKNNLKKDFLSLKQRLKIKDKQEFAVIENQKPTVAIAIKTDSVNIEKVNNDTELKVAKSEFHTVKKGETLFSISKEYGVKVKDLIKINNMKTESILAGQRLKISGIETAVVLEDEKLIAPTNVTTANKPANTKPKFKTHMVKSGETLSEIAEKYNCTVRELKAWNSKSNTKLSLGEKLKVKK